MTIAVIDLPCMRCALYLGSASKVNFGGPVWRENLILQAQAVLYLFQLYIAILFIQCSDPQWEMLPDFNAFLVDIYGKWGQYNSLVRWMLID